MSLFYSLARPILHRLDPEKAHQYAVRALASGLVPKSTAIDNIMLKQHVFGLEFHNPVGMAAGFDKNAEAVNGLAGQGFGFVEVGTVTPKPQDGNPAPRMFRLKEDEAVINRLGFNNEGSDAMRARLSKLPKQPIVLGINIGRNKECDDPVADYQHLVTHMFDAANYITINVSSPNTKGLRDMQQKRQLHDLLSAVTTTHQAQKAKANKHVPLLLKISPDIDGDTKEDIAELALSFKLDGLIISNTTIKRPNTLKHVSHHELGGLSGKPLMTASTKLLGDMYGLTKGEIPLIGVGGISSADDAYQKILAGASLVQIYTAFVYQGFGLVKKINTGLIERLKQDGYTHISEAVGKAY